MENNQLTNPENNNETDILVLLEYFKKGIKRIFKGIGFLFKNILCMILWFLLLLKKNIIFIAIVVGLFFLFSLFRKNFFPALYSYEISVTSNYNSTDALYNVVESIKTKINNKEISYLRDISISPIKSLNEQIDAYYSLIDNPFDVNANFKQDNNRDTIILKQLDFESFQDNILNKEFKNQIITFESNKKLSKKGIHNLLINPIENNENFIRIKTAYIKSLDLKIKYNETCINRIDTLLINLSNKGNSAPTSFSIKGESKNNLEKDLLDRYDKFTSEIVNLENKKALYSKVLNIISEGSQVRPKGFLGENNLTFILAGFIFSILLILLLRLWKYLSKLEKQKSA